jgi:hypothetical protein
MQRYDPSAIYCMIYPAQVPWRSWIQALSRNHKTSGEKCYKLDWNPDPSNRLAAGGHNRQSASGIPAGGVLITGGLCLRCNRESSCRQGSAGLKVEVRRTDH